MSDLVISDVLEDVLSHQFVIDATLYKTDNVYHGKVYTVGGHSLNVENESLTEMLLELRQQINELFNKERN